MEAIKHKKDRAAKCAICQEVFEISLRPLYGIREVFSSLGDEKTTSETGNICEHSALRRKFWCADCSVQLCDLCAENHHFDHNLKMYKAILKGKITNAKTLLTEIETVDLVEFQIANEMKELQKKQEVVQKIKKIKLELTSFVDSNGIKPLSDEMSEIIVSNEIKDQLEQMQEQLKPIELIFQIDNLELGVFSNSSFLGGYEFRVAWIVTDECNETFLALSVDPEEKSNAKWKVRIRFQLILLNSTATENIETGFVTFEFTEKGSIACGGRVDSFAKYMDFKNLSRGFVSEPARVAIKVQIQELNFY